MDTPALRTTETKSADAARPTPRRFDPTRLLIQRDRLPWFWFFFTIAVLLLSAMDRYHIVSQFKQRERVVIIDPAGDPEAVNLNSGKSQRDFDHPTQRYRVSGYAGSKVQP